ncbi:MAG: peptidoglycan-binding protein [Thermoleophilia bacterium]|nr:peptidoglycan-binding protein [Thermoleophilia bacterium]
MAGRDPNRGRDFDDWFDEPSPPPEPRRRGSRRADDDDWSGERWTIPDAPRRRPQRQPLAVGGRTVTPTQLAVAAGSAVVLLVAILAAAGVFSSSGRTTTPLPTRPAATPAPPATRPTTPSAPTVKPPTTTLKPGDTGAQVTLLQKALIALGYSPGKADGAYGPGTKQAVTQFQTASGLAADGVVGPKTLAALARALAAKTG